MNQTIAYYNKNAKAFCDSTFHADMSICRNRFLHFLPKDKNITILDAGCGSGRDSRYFLERGFSVEAMDASEKICEIATQNIGQKVQCMRFQDITYIERFDGIWACASLLHVSRAELPAVLHRLYQALQSQGILYASFKYGASETVRGERQFSDLQEDSGRELLVSAGFSVLECFVTMDVRAERKGEKWLNIIGKKPG
ncbi:MAG: class I SAM-dependent methyltransferase [Bacteroides sp.]|nr:class I SAM-dependent methyltransferase [Bacteroides sp.]MCM1550830.1 class I SAM-dependent methyltransferase [Clostridium sp.]